MSNRWGIPNEIEKLVIKRDLFCVYCRIDFSINHESRKTKPTWEQIVNDVRISTADNISLSCTSCNASKGAKLLSNWLNSRYCISKEINQKQLQRLFKMLLKTQQN